MESIKNIRKNKKRTMNGIDWLILLLLVALAIGGVWWFSRVQSPDNSSVAIVYTLAVYAVKSDAVIGNGGFDGLMPRGATVTNEKGSQILGEIESFVARPTLVPSVKEGEAVFLEEDGRVDLYVRVRADATYSEGDCFRVGDLPVFCGALGDFRIGAYAASGCRIVRIEREVMP